MEQQPRVRSSEKNITMTMAARIKVNFKIETRESAQPVLETRGRCTFCDRRKNRPTRFSWRKKYLWRALCLYLLPVFWRSLFWLNVMMLYKKCYIWFPSELNTCWVSIETMYVLEINLDFCATLYNEFNKLISRKECTSPYHVLTWSNKFFTLVIYGCSD